MSLFKKNWGNSLYQGITNNWGQLLLPQCCHCGGRGCGKSDNHQYEEDREEDVEEGA